MNALQTSDIVAAEDTRRTLELAKRLNTEISGRLISLHDHNEATKVSELVDEMLNGSSVLVVSDAGMPMINDPGFKLTQAAISTDITITCLPGPSAPLAALILSGLPTHKFCYEGFLPPKSASRQKALTALKDEVRTMIFLESTHRIAKTLKDMRDIFGDMRKAALARELTKKHEEVIRADLAELAEIAQNRALKGEMCIVVAGAEPTP